MFQKLVIAGIALLTAACVPIPPEPPASASVSAQTETLAEKYESADCPGGYIDLQPGQSAYDPPLSSLPGYVDIIRVESSLDGETLTAIFHLRSIPEKLEFSRKGVDNFVMEYMWTIGIDIDNAGGPGYERTDFTLSAFHAAKRVSEDTPSTIRPFKNAVEIDLWEDRHFPKENRSEWRQVLSASPQLLVSHEENTLTLISKIPGITDESSLSFSTYDIVKGQEVSPSFPAQDGVSCLPG